MCCQMYQNYAINCRYIWVSWFYNGLLVWGLSSAGRAPALQAGGSGFESRRLHQTEIKLKKPLQKCRGFSVNCSNTVPIRPDKCLINGRFGHPSTHARVSGREVLEVTGCCPLRVRTSCEVSLRLSSRDRM